MTPETIEILNAADRLTNYHEWQVGEEAQQVALQVQCRLTRALCEELAMTRRSIDKIVEAQEAQVSFAAG